VERYCKLTLWLGLCLALVMLLAGPAQAAEKASAKTSVSEQILEILLARKIVSQEKYQELKEQVLAEQKAAKAAEAKSYEIKHLRGKGLAIESKDGQNSVRFTGRLQLDGKMFSRESGHNSSMYVRRARLAARVRWHKYYSAVVEAEFGKGKAFLNDGYIQFAWWDPLRFRFGQYKQPFSLEEIQSDNWTWLMERSLVNSLAPSRDLGAMAFGMLGPRSLFWYLSLSNGQGKNEFNDVNESKDLVGRLSFAPLRHTGKSYFKDLYLGGSFTYGDQDSKASDWWRGGKMITQAGTTWFQVDPTAAEDGLRTRLGAEIYWSVGPFGFMGEFVRANFQGMVKDSQSNDLGIWGGYAQASWMITGEHLPYKYGKPGLIAPTRNFDWGAGKGWGGWQLVMRYDYASADSGWRSLGYVDPLKYSDGARGWTLGINWYLNDMVRTMFNFFDYRFDQKVLVNDTLSNGEQGFMGRIQFIF
jgi:phosphate-selective porin OprO and OprP